MVTITGYNLRQKEGEEKSFITLNIEGDIEMVQSSTTNRFYATVRRCSISSTFDEATAKRMVGKEMAGQIIRVQCDPYEYTVPETSEVVTLGYSWDYVPEGAEVTERSLQLA